MIVKSYPSGWGRKLLNTDFWSWHGWCYFNKSKAVATQAWMGSSPETTFLGGAISCWWLLRQGQSFSPSETWPAGRACMPQMTALYPCTVGSMGSPGIIIFKNNKGGHEGGRMKDTWIRKVKGCITRWIWSKYITQIKIREDMFNISV